MRITENGLRKIIREVIKESLQNDIKIQDHIIERIEEEHGCQISTEMGEGGIIDVKRCTDDPSCGENDVYILVHLEDEEGVAQGVIVYDNIKEEDFQMIQAGPGRFDYMRKEFNDITEDK